MTPYYGNDILTLCENFLSSGIHAIENITV